MIKKRLIRTLIILAITVCAVGGIWIYSSYSEDKLAAQRLEAADEAIANGDYEQACSIYESCYYNTRYAAQVKERYAALAEKAKSELNPAPMIRYYKLYEDRSELESLYVNLGDELFAAGEYQSAIDCYMMCKVTSNCANLHDAQVSLGHQYLEEHDWDAAKQCFRDANETDLVYNATLLQTNDLIDNGQGDEVPEILSEFTGQDVANTVFRALNAKNKSMTDDQKAALAGEYGEKISHTDTQLMYCKLLIDNGYDLNAVYPNGVQVDYDLSKYDYSAISEAENYDDYDMNKVLVFSWEDMRPSLNYTVSKQWADDDDFPIETLSVKLHPELMVNFSQQFLPSAEQYSAVAILKKGYQYAGNFQIVTTTTSSYTKISSIEKYCCYAYYYSYEAIYLCDLKTGNLYCTYDGYVNKPRAYGALQRSSYANISFKDESGKVNSVYISPANVYEWNTAKIMLGTFEDGWLEQNLQDDALYKLIIYPLITDYIE